MKEKYKINYKNYGILIILIGIIVSITAAFYSIFGLSKLFSGAAIAVIIMASTLELAKLVITATLKVFWKDITLKLRIYLVPATIILMLITSMGIYGFLSASYQNVYVKNSIYESEILIFDKKLESYQKIIDSKENEKNGIIKNLENLTKNINTVNQTVDKRTGQLIIKNDLKSQQIINNQIVKYNEKINDIDSKISVINDSIQKITNNKHALSLSSNSVADLGPLKYIAKISNQNIDIIVNYLILIIVFVFDPLAIALLILGIEILKINQRNLSTDSVITHIGPSNEESEIQITPTEENIMPMETDNVAETLPNNLEETKTIDQLIEDFKLPERKINQSQELSDKIILKNKFKNLVK